MIDKIVLYSLFGTAFLFVITTLAIVVHAIWETYFSDKRNEEDEE